MADPIPVLQDPLWEQQPGETDAAYASYRIYRDLPPQERSIAEAARRQGRARAQREHWSRKYRWIERTRAYDAWVDTIRRSQLESSIREDAAERARAALEFTRRERALLDAAMGQVERLARWPLHRITQETDEEGRQVTIIEPARWDVNSYSRMLGTVLHRMRLNLGLPADGSRAPEQQPEQEGYADVDAWLGEITKQTADYVPDAPRRNGRNGQG